MRHHNGNSSSSNTALKGLIGCCVLIVILLFLTLVITCTVVSVGKFDLDQWIQSSTIVPVTTTEETKKKKKKKKRVRFSPSPSIFTEQSASTPLRRLLRQTDPAQPEKPNQTPTSTSQPVTNRVEAARLAIGAVLGATAIGGADSLLGSREHASHGSRTINTTPIQNTGTRHGNAGRAAPPAHAPRVDSRGIPVDLTDAQVREMKMQIPFSETKSNPTGQPTVVGEVNPNTGDYVVTCPYCGKPAEVNQQQMNCHIFRCGPAGPHDSFERVLARRQDPKWKGDYCGGPYQVVKHRNPKDGEYGVAKQCSYNK